MSKEEIYEILYEMRLAPRHQLELAAIKIESAIGTQAAANKAAEEGEQFVAIAARIFDFKPHKQQPEHKAKYVQFALEAIAADRASRQVANKAEVEPACVCGSPTTLGSVHRTDGPCYVAEATPPATTGASTVLTDERCEEIDYDSAFNDHLAAQAGQVAVPGWKLVPIKPTIEMIAAMQFKGDVDIAIGHANFCAEAEKDYAAMLAAAPSPAKEST